MVYAASVLPKVFKAIEKSDIQSLSCCTEDVIRPILPCLVRMSLIAPLDHSQECIQGRKVILCILSGIEAVNALVALLSIDFTALEADVKREQSLRQKIGATNQNDSVLIQGLSSGLALEFECSDPTRRLRLLLSELLFVMAQAKEPRQQHQSFIKPSELFDNECYLEEVSDVLCIALAELPYILPPSEVAEALLHLSHGPEIICKMVANQPDCFNEVVSNLVLNGEKQDEESQGGLIRMQTLRNLCLMNPSQALCIRSLCVESCLMPALTIYITIDIEKACESNRLQQSTEKASRINNQPASILAKIPSCVGSNGVPNNMSSNDEDLVAFLTGVLLSNNQQQRLWLSYYLKTALRRKSDQSNASAITYLRSELISRLQDLLLFTTTETLPDSKVVEATSLLRLYCALKALAALKFSEDKEISLLLNLVTCRPPATASGVRFVSTGLCMLISCPSLIALPDHERKASQWIKWLATEQNYFVHASNGIKSSFGAMLLLLAIHFHLQQLSAIIDLVSAALGMKVVVASSSSTRVNNLSKIKYIFTHDVFTEAVVTAHAAKVPVTRDLNVNMSGFLPVHCIYHQLKSHMFTKHKVHIKEWIFRQICSCSLPLHHVMPQLIEAYVSSILIPSSKNFSLETFNQPITEAEITAVFQLSCFPKENKDKEFIIIPSVSNEFGDIKTEDKNMIEIRSVITSQLILLYYLLLYEDVRLSNMNQLSLNQRVVHTYSSDLFAQLPIRYLLSCTQKDQKLYAGLFNSLLKLLITHFPQLCLLRDWMYEAPPVSSKINILPPRLSLTTSSLSTAMKEANSNPGHLLVLLNRVLRLPSRKLWRLAPALTDGIKFLLDEKVPRKILDTYVLVWFKLNSLFPRRLWAMTVEGLRSCTDQVKNCLVLSEEDVVLDPLNVLRCDVRVFRCAPMLEITIYLLQVYLLSSRSFLSQHILNNPCKSVAGVTPVGIDEEREKLKCALVLAQESAAVQLVLEASLENKEDKKMGNGFVLQEIRSIICSHLHQSFIKDTTLAKLVHFQGYSASLLGAVVEGVPSMHIAVGLNWMPELLQLPDLEKRIFALQLTSHLALQNSMPSTLSIARLVVSTLATLLSVMGESDKLQMMERSCDALVRIGRAFPVLIDDLVHLLVSYARVTAAQSSIIPVPSSKSIGFFEENEESSKDTNDEMPKKLSVRWQMLSNRIRKCFWKLTKHASASKNLY